MIKESIINTNNGYSSLKKITFIVFVIALHAFVWAFVNNYNSHRPIKELYNLTTLFDNLIPYLGWSWPVYYLGHLYVIIGSSLAIWNYSKSDFRTIVVLFCLMIITGGIIQLLIPAKSPLPNQMGYIHNWIHQNISNDPFVCFPSMHVSLAALPTFLLYKRYKSYLMKIILMTILALIFISTITLKEHFFIDAVAGLLLAYFFFTLFNAKIFLKYKKEQKNEWARSDKVI